MGRAWVGVVLLCLIPGCKKPPTDDKPEATKEQLYAEQERIQRGEVVGEPLRAPKVVVDATRVTVNGHLVATRGELGTPTGRVEKLFAWAKGLREHWKMIHPGDAFVPAVDVTLPPELSFAEGLGVARSLAWAGFGRNMTFHSGGLTATFDYTVPGPPVLDETPKPKPKLLELCRGDSWKARVRLPLLAPPFDQPDKQEYTSSPWQASGPNTVAEPIRELCANACEKLEIGNASSFQEALSIVTNARVANNKQALTVAFTTCSVEEKPAPAPPVSNGSSKLRIGATTVSGGLSPETVTGVLATAHPFVQQCYENGLARNPALTGRVSTKLTIDETGAVVSSSNGGSDVPDAEVVTCAVKAFAALRFPKPGQGTVVVVHPLLLEPNDKRSSRRDGG